MSCFLRSYLICSVTKILNFTPIELLQELDSLVYLGCQGQVVIPTIFGNHSMGIEDWDIKEDVIDAFINIFAFFFRIVELLKYFREKPIE